MTDEPLSASVIVPVLNEEDFIERSVAAILEQRFDRPFEILVIDGGSEDGTPEILERVARRHPQVRLLSNPARLIPNALNIGLREAKGTYIVRMDAHAYYPTDYIALAVERFEAGGVECVSGPQQPHGEDAWSRRVALALNSKLGIGGATFRNPSSEIEVDTAFTGVWRRALLLELGGWDEDWPINEDAELAARIRERGGRYVCLPAMAARYVPRRSLRALAVQYWKYGQYRAKTARHHPIGLRRSHVLPPALAATAIGAVVGPGRVRGIARVALLPYACAVVVAAITSKGDDTEVTDRLWLPVVFAVMHLSWGAGFIAGSVRFGPPLAALASLARGGRDDS